MTVMPLSSHKREESLDITTVAQIAAAQKRLCNFVLLTGREQQKGMASAQRSILVVSLLLRANSHEEEPHPFSQQMSIVLCLL